MSGQLQRRVSPSELLPSEDWLVPARHAPWSALGGVLGASVLLWIGLGFFGFASAFALVIWLVAIVLLLRRRGVTGQIDENQRAVNLLGAGDVDEAAQIFEKLAHDGRAHPGVHALFVFNRGVAYVRQGRLERAHSIFNGVERSRQFERRYFRRLIPHLYSEMATCLALQGMSAEARHYANLAADNLDPSEVGRLAIATAIIELRAHNYTGALDDLASNWQRAEGVLMSTGMKILRILRAFALAHADRPDEANAYLAGLHPFRKGDFDWLGVQWPEMRRFLQDSGLG